MRTQIPIRLIGGSQPLIVVPASFNGAPPVDCALDTGAGQCMLLPEVGASLGVAIAETRRAMGAGGPVEVQIGRVASVAVGDATAKDLEILMSPELARIGAVIGTRLGGNIGFNFLERFRVTIDYERLLLDLADADEPRAESPTRVELPFTLAHPQKPLILIAVRANDEPFQFALDTGASTTVIAPALAKRCGVEGIAIPSMSGGGGAVAASAGVLDKLAIDRLTVSRVRVVVAEFLDALGQAVGVQLDGILGTNVLRRFRVTIDYPGRSLRLDG